MVYKFELWLGQTLSLNYNHLEILLTYNYTILFLLEIIEIIEIIEKLLELISQPVIQEIKYFYYQ